LFDFVVVGNVFNIVLMIFAGEIEICELLQFYIGCSIEEIGSIDLSFTL